MYPGGNNYNYNQNPQQGYNMPQSTGYQNPNPMGYGPPIGFNVGSGDYNQGYPPGPPMQNTNPQGCFGYLSQQMNQPQGGYGQPQGGYGQPQNYGYPNQQPYSNVNPPYSGQMGTHYPTSCPPNDGYGVSGSFNSTVQQPAQYQQYHQPQQQHQQYHPGVTGGQKVGGHCEVYRGTIKPSMNFSAEQDCNVLRKAMKGLGTDEKAIIECLGRRSLAQRLDIKKTFKTMFGKDLIEELKSELSGDFCRSVVESLYDQDFYDAYSLRKAMEGAGTRENTLTEILTSRSNQQIENIKLLYKKWYNRDLEKDIVSETSSFYKRILVSCLQANKKEMGDFNVDINLARQEAQELYNAGEKKLGTDEACFIKIFSLRSKYQLRATFDEYQRIAGRDILSSIDREMSGDLAAALKAMAQQAINPPGYFATMLYKAMKGAGTNDNTLIRILLTRSEIDLENIKTEFQKQYGKTLQSFVESETSGDYRKYLMRFVMGN